MARKVQQMSTATVVKKVVDGKQDTFWVSGLKIDKWAGDETQHITTYYIEPQEVKVDVGDTPRWGSEYAADRITMLDVRMPDGSTKDMMRRWEANQYGIKFFKDEEHAKKYFLVVTKNLYDATARANEQYKLIHAEIEQKAPSFIRDLEIL
jgi:hypothetical protein